MKTSTMIKVLIACSDTSAASRLWRALADERDFIVHRIGRPDAVALDDLGAADVLVATYPILQRVHDEDASALPRLMRRMWVVMALSRNDLLGESHVTQYAHGWIFGDESAARLVSIVRLCVCGYSLVPDAVARRFAASHRRDDAIARLSLIECAALHELALGRGEALLARQLGLSKAMTASLLRVLLGKLSCASLAEARELARDNKVELQNHRRLLIRQQSIEDRHALNPLGPPGPAA